MLSGIASAALPSDVIFHSRPGAPFVIWLNIEGGEVTGSQWNTDISRETISTYAFSLDSSFDSISGTEKTAIKQIWLRVAEDFAPFNVDVTTEKPTTITINTASVYITSKYDTTHKVNDKGEILVEAKNPFYKDSGAAYFNAFGGVFSSAYGPIFVYQDNLSNRADYIAETISNKLGYNLGLSYDGVLGGDEQYKGHGTGETSWAPIMGVGNDRKVTQWSKGEYTNADENEDDLTRIANKLGYRTDDHSDTKTDCADLEVVDEIYIYSTTLDADPENANPVNKGVIERTGDVDVFKFATGQGSILINAIPTRFNNQAGGGNLDVSLELYDDRGELVQSSSPDATTSAYISTIVPQGIYFVHVKGVGTGDPEGLEPVGYTEYGSLGNYFLSGKIVKLDPLPPVLDSVQINDDKVYTLSTTVEMNHNSTGGLPDEYRVSERSDFAGASWEAYSSAPTFNLSRASAYGVRTIYMQLRSYLGVSATVSDTINYTNTTDIPVLGSLSINNGSSATEGAQVTLDYQWTGGLPTEYRASEDPGFVGAIWMPYQESPTFQLSSNGTRSVYVQLRNGFGTSGKVSDTIKFPTPASLKVFFMGLEIPKGYAAPSNTLGTDFGITEFGKAPVTHTFTVRNTGGKVFYNSGISVPIGYRVIESLPEELASGESDAFTVEVVNKLPGLHIGQVTISGSELMQFRVQGYVKPQDVELETDPVAIADEVTTLEDTEAVVRLLGNDPLDREITFRIVEGPTNGKLSGKAPNLVYTPKLNYYGTDSFVFVVNNGSADSKPATVKIKVTPVNDRPKAKALTVEVVKNKKKTFSLVGTDVDTPLSSLRYKVITEPNQGVLTWERTGRAVYVPQKDFIGQVRFKYIVKDGKTESLPKTVTLQVTEPE